MFDMSVHTQEIVLLLIAATLCGGVILHIIDAKDFLVLAGMVFVYYFQNTKNINANPPT